MTPAREIQVRGDMIRLGQLLKLADVVSAGGEVKEFLATTPVWVNGELENRRGRQLRPGDEIEVGDELIRLTS